MQQPPQRNAVIPCGAEQSVQWRYLNDKNMTAHFLLRLSLKLVDRQQIR